MPKKNNRKRRGKKEGSVFQMPNGKWRAQISIQGLNGKRRRVTRTGKTKEHAVLLLSELQAERPSFVTAGEVVRLSDYLSSWLKNVTHRCEDSTISVWKSLIKNHINPHIGSVNLTELTHHQIEEWLCLLREAGVGPRAISSSFSTLRTALNNADKKDWIPFNPCLKCDPPKYKREEIFPFTLKEAKKLLSEAKGTEWEAVFELGLTAGMRQEEIFGARWMDFSEENRTLSVQQVAAEIEGRISIKEPKTKSSIRKVGLTQTAVAAILEIKGKSNRTEPIDLILQNQKGTAILRSNFGSRVWMPLLKRLGYTHRGFHHTRHTAATLMLQQGIPVHIVSKQLGHARPSITLDIYAHFMPGDLHKAADAMQSIFNG